MPTFACYARVLDLPIMTYTATISEIIAVSDCCSQLLTVEGLSPFSIDIASASYEANFGSR